MEPELSSPSNRILDRAAAAPRRRRTSIEVSFHEEGPAYRQSAAETGPGNTRREAPSKQRPCRGAVWADELSGIAEFGRNLDPWARPLIVLLLPEGTVMPRGLDIVEPATALLTRLDLEVAARYALADTTVFSVKHRIRAELAIQLAAIRLPNFGALEILEHWLGAPDDVIADPDRASSYAEAIGLAMPKGRLALALWRAQFTVLMAEIDSERLRLIERESSFWQLPYIHPASEGRAEKAVEFREALELSHLCRQLRWNGRRPADPIRRRLELLRDVRNSLSHLEFLNQTEIEGLIERNGSVALHLNGSASLRC